MEITPNHSKDQQFLDRLTEIVNANLSNEQFTVSEFAREAGLSHPSLHRKLKKISNQSVSQFIRELRLKKAMELLQSQAGTVAEIAYEVGFGSSTYFSKCFHEFYGYPPGEAGKRMD
jgi:AraC-like DNA-binding protein